jgi:hypothetical protein
VFILTENFGAVRIALHHFSRSSLVLYTHAVRASERAMERDFIETCVVQLGPHAVLVLMYDGAFRYDTCIRLVCNRDQHAV